KSGASSAASSSKPSADFSPVVVLGPATTSPASPKLGARYSGLGTRYSASPPSSSEPSSPPPPASAPDTADHETTGPPLVSSSLQLTPSLTLTQPTTQPVMLNEGIIPAARLRPPWL